MDDVQAKLNLVYKIDKNNPIVNIFGETFVKNNKDKCKISYNGKTSSLSAEFDAKNISKENLDITLLIYKKDELKDLSYMFYSCDTLIFLPDIDTLDTSNVENMNSMFKFCESLQSLPDISKWNMTRVLKMSAIFSDCKSLESLPDI